MINELKLDELKNLFFYTFGIVPLQNYNVVGDGLTDNRLALQQAIYDAISINCKYIFVPKGNYYYSNQLFQTDKVIFVGNSIDTKIKDIEIRQFPDLWNEAQSQSSRLVPIGGIVLYAGKTITENYLQCDGQTVSTTDYINLYSILNNITVDEETETPETFTIPNLSTGNEGTTYIIRAK